MYSTLDDVPHFRAYFLHYLLVIWKTPKENLEIRYKRCCKALSEGDRWTGMRKPAVYGLRFYCKLKQYQIAKLLHVSTRTIRRDMRFLEEVMYGR